MARAWGALSEAPARGAVGPSSAGPGTVPRAVGASDTGACLGTRGPQLGRRALSCVPMTVTSPEAWRLLPTLQQAPGGPGECMWLRDRRRRKALKGTRSSIIYCHFLVTKDLNKTHSHLHGVSGLSVRQREAQRRRQRMEVSGGMSRSTAWVAAAGGPAARPGPHAVLCGAAERRLTSRSSCGHTAAPAGSVPSTRGRDQPARRPPHCRVPTSGRMPVSGGRRSVGVGRGGVSPMAGRVREQ